MGFSERSLGNKLLYLVYKFFVIFNNTIWYYFSPFAFRFVIYFFLFNKNVEVAEEGVGGEAPAAE